jgi:hypothetical protein
LKRLNLAVLICFSVAALAAKLDAATVNFCGGANECLCIYWEGSSGAYLEKRCPGEAGWVTSPTGPVSPGGDGSWAPSNPQTPPTAPGSPLQGELLLATNNAAAAAKLVIRGIRTYVEGIGYTYTPTTCSELFNASNYSTDGYQVLSGIIFRAGEGVQDAQGNVPCAQSAQLWTRCCNNSPYVMVCNSFLSQTSKQRRNSIIHETMHVAGQREDSTSATGPGGAPTTYQISSAVDAACP